MSRPKILHRNAILYWTIRTYNPDTMVLKDADSTPTVAVRKNGASTADSVTVTKRTATTGIYDCSYNPAGEVEGDEFTIEETATVTGTTTGAATYSNSWEFTVLALERGTDNAASQTSVDTVASYIDTEVAAIKAKTDNLPAIPAAQSDCLTQANVRTAVGLAAANLDTQLGNIASYIDTEVAAIKAKTDNLPAIPAAQSDCLTQANVRTAIGLATANLDTQLGNIASYIDTEVAAIKAKTDNLPATPAAQSDCITAAGVRTAVGLAAANLDTQLGNIASYIDTEVAAIKAKTDNLPATPAAQSDCITAAGVRTAVGLAAANLDGQLGAIAGYIDTEVAAIKTNTDKLGTAMELNASNWRFTTAALANAPAGGGGGGGGTDWSADERTAIRSILGIPTSGTTPTDPTVGILDVIRDKTALITAGNVAYTGPVTATGKFKDPIIAGDDYLAANGRAFTWTISAISGITPGTASVRFAGKHRTSAATFNVSGTVTDLGTGKWTLSCDMTRTISGGLPLGEYDWSVEIVGASGTEITPVRAGSDLIVTNKFS